MDALIDPGIAEIIEHERLIRIEAEPLFHVGFRRRPLMRALVANAAKVEHDPVRLLRIRHVVDRLAVGLRAVGKILARALDIAELDDCFGILGVFGDDTLEQLLGVVGAIEGVEIHRHLNLGVARER